MGEREALRRDLIQVWEAHRDAGWPAEAGPNEGELMTLDTVISGCMVYFLDTPEGLDAPRVGMLESCLSDLDALLPELAEDCTDYFGRLRVLASLLLETTRPG